MRRREFHRGPSRIGGIGAGLRQGKIDGALHKHDVADRNVHVLHEHEVSVLALTLIGEFSAKTRHL
jgi:hypothetical protein